MGEMRESSVLFSLKELMSIEDQRLREEEAAARKRADDELQARLLAEARAKEAEEARVRAEEERRRVFEAQRREEEAKLEAMRMAEVEKARVAAEQKARLEAMEKQQEHEHKLAQLTHDKQKKRLQRLVTFGSLGALLLFGGGAGYYFGVLVPDMEKQRAAQEAQLAAEKLDRERLQRDFDEKSAKVDKLLSDLRLAQSQAETERLKRELDAAQKDRDKAKSSFQNVAKKDQPANTKCVCPEGDPLCGCLK